MKKIILFLSIFALLVSCRNGEARTNSKERITGKSADSGKPTAPVDITWDAPKQLAPGVEATVHYTVTPRVDTDKIVVRVRALDSVQLVSGDSLQTVLGKKAGQSITGSVIVKSDVEKLQFVAIDAEMYMGTRMMAGSTSVALQVGNAVNLQKSGPVNESGTEGGSTERFIDMPAK